jgi:hypothetical protein
LWLGGETGSCASTFKDITGDEENVQMTMVSQAAVKAAIDFISVSCQQTACSLIW